MEGSCTCGTIGYRLTDRPMIVHCCHCTWCQRETGSAFVVNALVERDRLEVTGTPDLVMTPSASGKGQEIARCPTCWVALWSHYPTARRRAAFVRVGTLRDPGALPPDVHIFTASRQRWFDLPADTPAYADFYSDHTAVWQQDALARWRALLAR